MNTILRADLPDFVTRHRPHGPLTADATEPAANGFMLTVACSCGVVFMRWVTPGEAADAVTADVPVSEPSGKTPGEKTGATPEFVVGGGQLPR